MRDHPPFIFYTIHIDLLNKDSVPVHSNAYKATILYFVILVHG